MTPAARTQAAIELLDQIIVAARDQGPAADVILARGFAARRYAGSKDRRAIRGLVYDAIRLCGERPESGRAAMLALVGADPALASAFDGSPYGPAPIGEGEAAAPVGYLPAWLAQVMDASGLGVDEQAALLARAPLDIRVNRLKADAAAVAARIPGAEQVVGVPDALRLPSDTPVERLPEWEQGWIEIQDAGSQLVTAAAPVERGHHVVDLCAGAGGKTLALAAAMDGHGSILACDVDRARLSRLPPRAGRAGVTIAETRLLDPGREAEQLADQIVRADVVLIDAPCSGTGTWRRNPEARWRLTPERLQRLVGIEARLLRIGSALVRPGGSLVYIVCSLLDAEGAGQVEAFLADEPGWTAAPLDLGAGRPRGGGIRLTPLGDSTDGFFVAKMVRS